MIWQRAWVPPGMPANVAGHTIPGGLIYVGQQLRSGVGAIEPALINPVLPVEIHDLDRQLHGLDPTPSYHLISSTARAGYLAWLAGGRADVEVPIGFVMLFFSGLERRVLLDRADDPTDPAVGAELPMIAAEVRRLRAAHGPRSRSFDSHASAFLDVLDLLSAPTREPAPTHSRPAPVVPTEDRWPVPLALRVALAQFAVTRRAIPADWARCWAWFHPSLIPSTPQTRCPDEFNALFALRYRTRRPAELRPSIADRPPIRIGYRPANPGIDTTVVERPDLPDVLEDPASTRGLGALVDSVTEALTPYSRWLARNPGGAGSIASTMLLPSDLLDHDPGPLRPLLNWANARLAGHGSAVVDGRDFAAFWSTADPARMSRKESEGLSIVLDRIGLGVEPDVRFGGVPLEPGPVVVFRLDPPAMRRPSPGYAAAVIMLSIAAATVLPGRGSQADDVNLTITALAAEVQLTVSERARLSARLRLLLATTGPRMETAARRRAETLTESEREAAGHFLFSTALSTAQVGIETVDSETVSALTTSYRWIGVPEDLLFRRLHQQGLGDDDGPVIVRRGRRGTTGPPIPPAPTDDLVSPPNPAVGIDAPVRLRQSVVDRTVAQTEAVSALLGGIFVETEPESVADAGPTFGLDQVHGNLLRELITRSSWSRAELGEIADRHGVLPDGALDAINEVALEITGDLAIEGDDELTVNDAVLREILT